MGTFTFWTFNFGIIKWNWFDKKVTQWGENREKWCPKLWFLRPNLWVTTVHNHVVGIQYMLLFVTWYQKLYGYTARQRRFLQEFKIFLLLKTHLDAAKSFSHRNIWKLFEPHIFIQTNIKRILILNKHRNRQIGKPSVLHPALSIHSNCFDC